EAAGDAVRDEVVAEDVEVRALEVDEVPELLVLIEEEAAAEAHVRGDGRVTVGREEADGGPDGDDVELQRLQDLLAIGPRVVTIERVDALAVAVDVEAHLDVRSRIDAELGASR